MFILDPIIYKIFKQDDVINKLNKNKFISYQNEDEDIQNIKSFIEKQTWKVTPTRKIQSDTEKGHYRMKDGILIYHYNNYERLVVPRKLVIPLIKLNHNSFIL